jgi:S-adenosylmethionine decarboxylase
MVRQYFKNLPIGFFMKIINWITILIFFVHLSQAESVYGLSCMLHYKSAASEPIVHLGNHIIAEFLECESMDDYEHLEAALCDAAQAANATVIKVMTHKFSPIGMTGIVLLSESHISIHTWPEFGYVAVDIYTCGEHVDVYAAIESLKGFFKPQRVRQIKIERGYDQFQED